MTKYALCSPEDIRAITMVTASAYSHDDPMIKTCILLATSAIERYCGRTFAESARVDTFTVPRGFRGAFRIYPSAAPVKDGTLAATINGTDVIGSLTGYSTYYEYDAVETLEDRRIVMSYTGGYPEKDEQTWTGVTVLDVPQEIVQACALQASYMANRFLRDNVGEKATGMRSGAVAIIAEVAVALIPWVRPRYMGA